MKMSGTKPNKSISYLGIMYFAENTKWHISQKIVATTMEMKDMLVRLLQVIHLWPLYSITEVAFVAWS